MIPSTEADTAFEDLAVVYADAVGPLVERGQDFALLDFPNYSNVGDSAIYLGELAFFDRHVAKPPAYVCDHAVDPAEVSRFVPEGPVFIQGGGNFGDIWQRHRAFRLRVLETLRGRPVVQLPQSIHFNEVAARDEMARAIDRHGNVTLLTRDRASFDFARAHFDCAVTMCPDAAVNIRHLAAGAPTAPALSFLRGDCEAAWAAARDLLAGYGEVRDWPKPDVWNLPDRIQQKLLWQNGLTEGMAMAHQERMYRRHARIRLNAGVRVLSQGRLIISDRLHVHLIAALMRRPHILMDNVYGKIGRHIDAWGDFGLAQRVNDMPSLKAALSAKLTGGDTPMRFGA